MGILDNALGGLLVASYANSILYALELVAVVRYYRASKRNGDAVLFQLMVYFTFVIDTVSSLTIYITTYLYTITHWGDNKYLEGQQRWPPIVSLAGTGITALIVQSFLIFRYQRMSQNKYITSALILLMLLALGGIVGTIVTIVLYTSITERNKLKLWATIWVSTSAAVDISIALALLWQLSRIKSPFKATKSLICRLMASTIRTGAVTSVFAIIILILSLVDQQSSFTAGFAYCLARIYALTMFYNLNNRGSLKGGSSNTSKAGNTMSLMFYVHRTTSSHYGSSDASGSPTQGDAVPSQ